MDTLRFDGIARRWAERGSRRAALGALAASNLTALLLGIRRDAADARRGKKKRKRKPLERNAFGCVDVGKACRGNDANCCSNLCDGRKPKKGKPDKSRCVAHNTGDCAANGDLCSGVAAACGTGGGFCFKTTGNASFCGAASTCMTCRTDADCEPVFGSGAACGVCAGCSASSDTICVLAAP